MKKLLLSIVFLAGGILYAQENKTRTFHFSVGPALHVTPIYLQPIPNVVVTPVSNVLPQEGLHYSGLALGYSIEKEISDEYSVTFSQQFRYDILYAPLTLTFQSPNFGYPLRDKQAFTTDLSMDFTRSFPAGLSLLKLGIGLGVGDLGSKYFITEEYRTNGGQTILVTTQHDYIYPFASFVFSWAKKNIQANLRMNYCPINPGFFGKAFFQPQLGLQYRLFSF